MKTGPILNLIKKNGERGGGRNPTSLTVSSLVSDFDKEAKSDKKKFWGRGRGGGGGGTETKTTDCVK